MEVAEVVETELVDKPEAGRGALDLGDGDGAVQLDDRGAGPVGQLSVLRGDLRPVARRLGVQRGDDGGLQDVGPAAAPSASPRSNSVRPAAICAVSHRDPS